jgi:lipopolysaccharide transport system ATP-binding protein
MKSVVVFDHVSKKFRRGERHDSLRDLVPTLLRKAIARRAPAESSNVDDFWALRDVSFEVHQGEALGVIGPNGAGKSTTLKLLTRILRPTEGHCSVQGRVGALIEVAAGFHPDLTGRENIYLQGAVMGMKRADVARNMDRIIEFAGVGAFVDTPVKRYSSGMNARLGFSISAHLEPDVLIVDEVLSVGDMEFQQRCIERMIEFKRNGAAIVFVSHDLQAVSRLCDRALFLRHEVRHLGPTADVISAYLMSGQPARGSADDVAIEKGQLLDAGGQDVRVVTPTQRLTVRATYMAHRRFSDFHFGFLVYRSTDGLVVYDETFSEELLGLNGLAPGQRITIDYSFSANLTRGQYHIELHAYHKPTHRFVARCTPAAVFSVDEMRTFAGVAYLDVRALVTESARTVQQPPSFAVGV